MILIDSWTTQIAKALGDPLLTPQRLLDLRSSGMLRISREEHEVLGLVCLTPIGHDLAIVHGLWISDPDPDEQRKIGCPLVSLILDRAEDLGRTALVPQWVMPYVERPVLTCKEAEVDLSGLQSLMNAARIPRGHRLRTVTFKIAGRTPQVTASAPRTTTTSHAEL